jgi:predicted Zn finger-like uncharacterized protein
MLKIGMTEKEPKERVRELYGTGVISPFALVHAEQVSEASAAEAFVHRYFESRRVNPNREFFAVSAEEAIAAMKEAAIRFSPSSTTNPAPTRSDAGNLHTRSREPVEPRESAAIALAEAAISIDAALRTYYKTEEFPSYTNANLSIDERDTEIGRLSPSERRIFSCPKCSTRLRVPDSQSVMRVRCTHCSENMMTYINVVVGKIYIRRFQSAAAAAESRS